MIHYTSSTVEVYFNNERIAFHKRNPSMGIYNTIKDHLSTSHQAFTEWSPEYFKQKAANHGTYVLEIIEKLIANTTYLETSYKSAMGIIQLHKLYGSQRLNDACQRAVYAGTNSYRRIKNILKFNQDKEPLPSMDTKQTHIPPHANLRGASAYQ